MSTFDESTFLFWEGGQTKNSGRGVFVEKIIRLDGGGTNIFLGGGKKFSYLEV